MSTVTLAEQDRGTARTAGSFGAVAACFVLSGFAALLYETAWMRQFSIAFGTSQMAVATVLAAYMAGLAFGALVAGRFVGRVRRPVLVYGLLELGIALGALAVPLSLKLAQGLYVWLLGNQPEPPDAGGYLQPLFYAVCTFAIILLPTGLMGATLPMLTRHAVRSRQQVGSRVGLLYALNTAGAVLGTLAAAFALLPWLGLNGTVYVGVGINALVFALAVLIARRHPDAADAVDWDGKPLVRPAARDLPTDEGLENDIAEDRVLAGRAAWILPMIGLSGAVSFTYEVMWTRLLGQLLGASLYAFATMLASFLLGITLGSAMASRLAQSRAKSTVGFALAQVGTAVLSLAVYHFLSLLPGVAGWLDAGEHVVFGSNAIVALLVLLPATICIGATFPFAVRILASSALEAGPASARVYSWNTVGAISGALLAGFVLLPELEFRGTAGLAIGVNLLLALACCLVFWQAARKPILAVLIGGLLLALAPPRTPTAVLQASPFTHGYPPGEIEFLSVGRSATIVILREEGSLMMRANGLPQSVIREKGSPPVGTHASQRWLTALPILARPDAESLLMIGFGGGVAAEDVPQSIRSIDAIELEPEVIAANRAIAATRMSDPLADERLNIIINDARSALALTTKKYDIIVSQPAHPWTAGASHLYTREFLLQAKDHLNPDGVLLQWMNAGFLDESLLKTLGATLLDVFKHVRLYRLSTDELMFLASETPLDVERQIALTGEPLKSDSDYYRWLGIGSINDVCPMLALDVVGLKALCQGTPVNTDDDNRLAMRFPITRLRPDSAKMMQRSLETLDNAMGPESLYETVPGPLNRVSMARRTYFLELKNRAMDLAENIPDESERFTAIGVLLNLMDDPPAAEIAFRSALTANPQNQGACFMLVMLLRKEPSTAEMREEADELSLRLVDPAKAVAEGRVYAATNQWDKVEELDQRLSLADSDDLCYENAAKLRAHWRIQKFSSPDQTLASEALEIVDQMLPIVPMSKNMLVRISAAAAARQLDAVLRTVQMLITRLSAPEQFEQSDTRQSVIEISSSCLGLLNAALKDYPEREKDINDLVKRLNRLIEAANSFAQESLIY